MSLKRERERTSPSLFPPPLYLFTMDTHNKSINFHQFPVSARIPGLVKAARHPWLFGASLTAMRNLGRELGYTLVHLSDVDRGRGKVGWGWDV